MVWAAAERVGRLLSSAAVNIPAYSNFEDGNYSLIDLDFAEFESSVTFKDFGAIYRQLRGIRMTDPETEDITLTFQAGVEYQLEKLLEPGHAQFVAQGTEENPVRFFQGWEGDGTIRIGSVKPSSLVHVELDDLGYRINGSEFAPALLTSPSSGTHLFQHLSSTTSYGAALSIQAPLSPASSNIVMEGYFETRAQAMAAMPLDAVYDEYVLLLIIGIEREVTLVDVGVPYRSKYGITVGDGVQLTLEEGVDTNLRGLWRLCAAST